MRARSDYQTDERMRAKLAAIPLPERIVGSLLDVGCESGYWCGLAKARGATRVLGIDRGRYVTSRQQFVNFAEENRRAYPECEFTEFEIGRQWPHLGTFQTVLCMSVYHHIWNLCRSHQSIWFWLWQHCAADATLIWEGPLSIDDSVVRKNIDASAQPFYTRSGILGAAREYFDVVEYGRAGHVNTREVWICKPRSGHSTWTAAARVRAGAGGASKAFAYAESRRIDEIHHALNFRAVAGTLNLQLGEPFDWDHGYVRFRMLDVIKRGSGLDGPWHQRWMRAYPLALRVESDDEFQTAPVIALRFEEESYKQYFVEVISRYHLRHTLGLTDDMDVQLARHGVGQCLRP